MQRISSSETPPGSDDPRHSATSSDERATGTASEAFDVVNARTPEGHAIYIKDRGSSRLFRVSLARDPAETRLWCLFVEQRSAVGAHGPALSGIIGPGRLSRADALACLTECAEDPTAWLNDPRRARLMEWVLARPVVDTAPISPRIRG